MFTMMTKHNWYFVNDDEERKGVSQKMRNEYMNDWRGRYFGS